MKGNAMRSGLIWWLSALVLAGVAGVLTFRLLTTASPTPILAAESTNTQMVVVAATDLPFRRSITEEDLVVRKFPAESIPEGAALSVEQVVGKMSTVDIFSGEPVILEQLVTPSIVTSQLALSIPDSKTVMAVPTGSELIANRLVRPGDRIDLLGTFEMDLGTGESAGRMLESVALLQDLEVHAIILPINVDDRNPLRDGSDEDVNGDESGVFRTLNQLGQSVLLAVDLQDAMVVRHVLDADGIVDLVLRAPNDDGLTETVPVDQNYLADRYHINRNVYTPIGLPADSNTQQSAEGQPAPRTLSTLQDSGG